MSNPAVLALLNEVKKLLANAKDNVVSNATLAVEQVEEAIEKLCEAIKELGPGHIVTSSLTAIKETLEDDVLPNIKANANLAIQQIDAACSSVEDAITQLGK